MVCVCSSFQDAKESNRSSPWVVWYTVVQKSDGLSPSAAWRINQGSWCQRLLECPRFRVLESTKVWRPTLPGDSTWRLRGLRTRPRLRLLRPKPFLGKLLQVTVHRMLRDRWPVLSACNIGVLWPDGWMDQDATWYGGRPQHRRHCAKWGPSSLLHGKGHSSPPTFRPMSIVAKWLDGSGYHLVWR